MVLKPKGRKWLFAGFTDPDKQEGGCIDYQGLMSFDEAVHHCAEIGFDWAHLVEDRFGEPYIICFLNGHAEIGEDAWVMPSEVTDDDLR